MLRHTFFLMKASQEGADLFFLIEKYCAILNVKVLRACEAFC